MAKQEITHEIETLDMSVFLGKKLLNLLIDG